MGFESFSKPAHGKWRVVAKGADLFEVRQPDGEIFGTYASLSQAAAIVGIRQKAADLAARKATRPCMCCGKPFESEGIHNRLCGYCRHQGGDLDPHAIAPRSGRPR